MNNFIGCEDSLITLSNLIMEVHKNGKRLPNIHIKGSKGKGKTSLIKWIVNVLQLKAIVIDCKKVKKKMLFIEYFNRIENKSILVLDNIDSIRKDILIWIRNFLDGKVTREILKTHQLEILKSISLITTSKSELDNTLRTNSKTVELFLGDYTESETIKICKNIYDVNCLTEVWDELEELIIPLTIKKNYDFNFCVMYFRTLKRHRFFTNFLEKTDFCINYSKVIKKERLIKYNLHELDIKYMKSLSPESFGKKPFFQNKKVIKYIQQHLKNIDFIRFINKVIVLTPKGKRFLGPFSKKQNTHI